jgi:hypothetical protein
MHPERGTVDQCVVLDLAAAGCLLFARPLLGSRPRLALASAERAA